MDQEIAKADVKDLSQIMSRCNIYLSGELISNNPLAQDYLNFLGKALIQSTSLSYMATVDNELFTAGALLFGALAACQKNALSPHDVVDYLQVGDMVIYKKERCLVKSVSINEIKLVGNKDVTTIVPEKLFNHIVPFYC